MNILLLCYEYPPIGGGAAIYVQLISQELAKRGHHVDIVTMQYKDKTLQWANKKNAKYADKKNTDKTAPGGEQLPAVENHQIGEGSVTIHRVACLRKKVEICTTPEMMTYCWSAFWKARSLIKTAKKEGNPYHVNFTHFIIPTGLVSMLLSWTQGLPYVVTTHGSDVPGYNPDRFQLQHKLLKPLWSLIVRSSKTIVCLTKTLQDMVLQAKKDARVMVIPNAVDTSYFKAVPKQKKILLSSRLLPRKGFQYFLDAIAGMDLRGYEVNMTGDGPYRKELDQQLAMLKKEGKIKGSVTIHGWIAKEELNKLYEESSIFVFPSLMDNFSMALLDAMNARMAIIAANCAGNPEVVGDTALLVPGGDSAAIRRELLRLMKNPSLQKEYSIKARQRVLDNFTWDKVIGTYEELLKAAAGQER
ncbi:glycosyltransferase family 4 protein [Candidatus Woesearchaeota archaeon]|nr:glycosyltransferase family 4 protein [Candidatus Woesearchaeota archaeon]